MQPLPSLTEEAKENIGILFNRTDDMLFSNRLYTDIMFQEYCTKNNSQYCVMNFLAWMMTDDFGKLVYKKIRKEMLTRSRGSKVQR